jgi:hypothetical protein
MSQEQAGISFLVWIERGTSRPIYRCRPWMSDMSHRCRTPSWFLARLACCALRWCTTDARNDWPRNGVTDSDALHNAQTPSSRSATAHGAEWTSGKSRDRLAPVLTEASS